MGRSDNFPFAMCVAHQAQKYDIVYTHTLTNRQVDHQGSEENHVSGASRKWEGTQNGAKWVDTNPLEHARVGIKTLGCFETFGIGSQLLQKANRSTREDTTMIGEEYCTQPHNQPTKVSQGLAFCLFFLWYLVFVFAGRHILEAG